MSRQSSRRRFLAGLGGAGVVAAAGCVRRGQQAASSVDYPETAEATFRRWLPAPDALPGKADGYDAMHLRLGDLLASDDLPDDGATLRNLFARTGRDPLGIDSAEVREVVKIDLVDATVLLGAFDTDAVEAAAVRAGYTATTTDRGVHHYERSARGYALAVGTHAIVQSRHDEAATVVRRVLDAAADETDRYPEVDPGFERLSGELGGTLSWIHPGDEFRKPAGAVRSANGQDFVGGRAFFVQLYRFEDAEAATEGAVRDAVADSGGVPHRAPLDVTVDGRLGRAEYARDVDALYDEDRPLVPIVAWAFEPEAATGDVTVTHRAGDPVDAARLSLQADGEPTDRQFADVHDTVGPRDRLTVSPPANAVLRVVWTHGTTRSTLATYRIPEA